MKKENVIQEKSYSFALSVIKVYKHLMDEKREFTLSKQFLRSGTSIGANVEEAIGGQSRKDFLSKLSIAYKEARETKYWVRLLRDSGYLDPGESEKLLNECEEVLRIMGAIIKKLKTENMGIKDNS